MDFTLHRLDDNPSAGLIDDRLRIEIRNARAMRLRKRLHEVGA